MSNQQTKSLVLLGAFIITAFIQSRFINSTDVSIFSSVLRAAEYLILLVIGLIASSIYIAGTLTQLFRKKSNHFFKWLAVSYTVASLLWNMSAFLQWNVDLSRGLLGIAGLLTIIRLVQWLIYEPDGLRVFETTG